MFSNAFFEEAILKSSYFLKCIFRGSNFEEHLCFKMYFLRKQLFWSLWLLISVAAPLCLIFLSSKFMCVVLILTLCKVKKKL